MARTARTISARAKFLDVLRKTANVSLACRCLKVSRTVAYDQKAEDPEFSAQWDNALQEAYAHLEGEAWRRAFKGCKKPVYQGGNLVGYVMEYSDQLMQFLLKGNKPDKFKDRSSTELTGKDGGPIDIADLDTANRIAAIVRAIKERKAASEQAGS